MPWVTARLKEAWEEVVAVRLIGWLLSLPLSKAAVTPSDIAMPWVTGIQVEGVAVTPSDIAIPWVTKRVKEVCEEVVAVRVSGWLISLPPSTAAVTPSDIVMPWVTDL